MRRTTTTGLARIGLSLALAACVAQGPADEMGSIGMAVVTTGADGAIYRLTPGTRLSLTQISDAAPNWDYPLDGDGAVVTIRLPPGDYQADIYHDNGYTTQWPLERTVGDDPATSVTAALLTAQPVTISVVSGQTTSLAFQFQVATGALLSFDRGNVDVSIDVGEQQAATFSATADGTGDVAGAASFGGPNAAGLQAILPNTGATGFHISVSAQVTGPFVDGGGGSPEGGFFICAPLQILSASGTGSAGFAALIAETGHGDAPAFLYGPANICIVDHGDSLPNQVRIRLSREGAAETQTFIDVLGNAPTLFHNQLFGDLPVRVYDEPGGTFDTTALLGNRDLPMTLRSQIRDDNDFSIFWYRANFTGTVSFSFVGAP